jgi:hypothetical protein
VRHLRKSFSNKAEKTITSLRRRSFFCFLGCICYSFLVNIIPLSGTHIKKEPLSQNGSAEGSFSGVCNFLYILDMTVFSLQVIEGKMYKKATFYTYAYTVKYSLYDKNVLLFICRLFHNSIKKSNLVLYLFREQDCFLFYLIHLTIHQAAD